MSSELIDRLVLVVETEPLTALDIVDCLETAGATVLLAHRAQQGIDLLVDLDNITLAIVDYSLLDRDANRLCDVLKAFGIPYVIYSGYPKSALPITSTYVSKPAPRDLLLEKAVTVLN